MFLGDASESKGYRLCCLDSKKVIQSGDITFNETVMFIPGKESIILLGDQQDDNKKAELEVPSIAL